MAKFTALHCILIGSINMEITHGNISLFYLDTTRFRLPTPNIKPPHLYNKIEIYSTILFNVMNKYYVFQESRDGFWNYCLVGGSTKHISSRKKNDVKIEENWSLIRIEEATTFLTHHNLLIHH